MSTREEPSLGQKRPENKGSYRSTRNNAKQSWMLEKWSGEIGERVSTEEDDPDQWLRLQLWLQTNSEPNTETFRRWNLDQIG